MNELKPNRRARVCRYCGRSFRPHPRVGARQYACGGEECQGRRQRENEEAWRGARLSLRAARRNPAHRSLDTTILAKKLVSLEVIPCAALPLGLQLMAPRGEEHLLCRVGRQFESARSSDTI